MTRVKPPTREDVRVEELVEAMLAPIELPSSIQITRSLEPGLVAAAEALPCADAEAGQDTFLDPYAAEHEAEFFAVASEVSGRDLDRFFAQTVRGSGVFDAAPAGGQRQKRGTRRQRVTSHRPPLPRTSRRSAP